jgi:hypothetical protein
VKRELRKKSKNVSQSKSTYKEHAAFTNYKKNRSSSGYNSFFDKSKDKDFKKNISSFSQSEAKDKILPNIPISRTTSQSNI